MASWTPRFDASNLSICLAQWFRYPKILSSWYFIVTSNPCTVRDYRFDEVNFSESNHMNEYILSVSLKLNFPHVVDQGDWT